MRTDIPNVLCVSAPCYAVMPGTRGVGGRWWCLDDAKVLELPFVCLVQILCEERLAFHQWIPVCVLPNHRDTVWIRNLEHTLPVHLVRLDNPAARVLHRPNHPGERGGRHLERCRRVVLNQSARVLDLELRSVPVGALGVTTEENAELVDSVRDLIDHEPLFLLFDVVLAGKLVQREHGVIARMVRVVDSRTVDHLVTLPYSEVVGDRDRLVVSHEEPVEWTFGRRPGPHLCGASRSVQEDGGISSKLVVLAVYREILFVGSPSELGWLASFADEAIDAPGVDKLSRTFGLGLAHLGVPLGDVDGLDPELLRESTPPLACRRLGDLNPSVLGNVEQCPLDVVRDEPRVGAVGRDRGHRLWAELFAEGEHLLPLGVVAPLARGKRCICVASEPRLDHRVEVHHLAVVAELHEIARSSVDRQVEEVVPP
eukprot:m.192717 g.192717  ORF g.192717 m.192717 type:complete len:427 (+) comp24957_c0_seq1:1436-2716(+)